MRRILDRLENEQPGAENLLLQTRLTTLTHQISTAVAALRYRRVREIAAPGQRFTWDGVLDRRRLDSFADPFADLTVRDRATVEEARELLRTGKRDDAEKLRTELSRSLPPLKAAQSNAYCTEWIDRK